MAVTSDEFCESLDPVLIFCAGKWYCAPYGGDIQACTTMSNVRNHSFWRILGNAGLALMMLALVACSDSVAVEVYSNRFEAPLGTHFPEWTSSAIRFRSAADPPGAGELPPQEVINCESPNRAQRLLGEFGGPKIGTAADPGYNRTQVEQTIHFALSDLP